MDSLKDDKSEETLNAMFSKGLGIHSELEQTTERTDSESFQLKVRKAILLLEDCTRLVSVLDLFSRNEAVSEVPTSSLKFFLLPVLLGDLQMKTTDTTTRLELIKVAQTYYIDFLQRVRDYEIVKNLTIPKPTQEDDDEGEGSNPPGDGPPNLSLSMQERDVKIERFKQKKLLEGRIQELQVAVDNPTCDDDILREFYLSMIKKFVILTLDEMQSLKQEREILLHMDKLKTGKVEPAKPKPSRPLQPIIITRDAVQKQVFGMGYPSLPVMSIEEFYDERARNGWYNTEKPKTFSLMDSATLSHEDVQNKEDQEGFDKDEKEDRHDEAELARKRAWDEFTDEHKRGEGNRHNKG